MEDVIQYIVVIAIIVIGIVNAMRKSMEKEKTDPAKMTLPGKKVISTPAQETYQEPELFPKAQEEDWESWFRNDRTEEIKSQPEIKQAEVKQPEVRTSAYIPLKEVKKQKTSLSTSSSKPATQSERTSTIPGIRSRKEAKKAIIYSEIFNRKY